MRPKTNNIAIITTARYVTSSFANSQLELESGENSVENQAKKNPILYQLVSSTCSILGIKIEEELAKNVLRASRNVLGYVAEQLKIPMIFDKTVLTIDDSYESGYYYSLDLNLRLLKGTNITAQIPGKSADASKDIVTAYIDGDSTICNKLILKFTQNYQGLIECVFDIKTFQNTYEILEQSLVEHVKRITLSETLKEKELEEIYSTFKILSPVHIV